MNTAPPPSPTPSGLARWAPGLLLFKHYQGGWFVADLWAGISVCLVMIPSVVAYAGLMGVPPQHGLYAALVPLLVYPLFGSSRQIIVGPDIAISLLIASAIGPLAGGDPGHAAALAAMLAVLTGLLLVLGGRFRIGAVADFLSQPVLIGYMTGAALILMGSQLDKLFGVKLRHGEFFPRLVELAGKLGQTHWPTLALGLGLITVLCLLRRYARRWPAALVVFVLALSASLALDLDHHGVAVVGTFPGGLPRLAWPEVDWHEFSALFPAAMGIALLTYTEGILLARAFAAKNGYEVNANQELTALGLADVVTGLGGGFSVTGSQSRTAINDAAGGKTQLTGLIAAGALALFMLFLTPVMARLPAVALAAILIFGGFSLIEFQVLKRLYQVYHGSGVLAALTALAVVAIGVVPGILFGVGVSLLGLINRISHPPDAVLREVPGHGFHDLGPGPATQSVPGFITYRFYAPLVFCNAAHFVSRVRLLLAQSASPTEWLLLDAQAITDIDATAAEALHSLTRELQAQGIALKFAHTNRPLRAVLDRIGLADEIGAESFFGSVHECVLAFQARREVPRPSSPPPAPPA